jgi:hypothetical protein
MSLDPPDYAAAEESLLRSLPEVRASGYRHHEATVRAKLGMICEATNRPAEALDHLHAAERIVDDLGTTLYFQYREALDRLEASAP